MSPVFCLKKVRKGYEIARTICKRLHKTLCPEGEPDGPNCQIVLHIIIIRDRGSDLYVGIRVVEMF